MTVQELEAELLSLTFAERMQILQVLLRDFADSWTGVEPTLSMSESEQQSPTFVSPLASSQPSLEAFEALADQLADDFLSFAETPVPTLSEYAVSRAGLYEEHP
jgi:hypothetical protein